MAATLTAQPINYSLPGAYQGQQLDAENAYQQALNNIAQRQASLAHDTGFSYNQGEDGTVNNLQIDPNNQYSAVMGLLGNHASAVRNLRDQLAGRGLTGNKGLAAKRAALLKFVQTGETSGLGTEFLNRLSGLYGEKSNALSQRNNAFNQAEQGALQYALQNQLFNTPAFNPATNPYAPSSDSGGGGGSDYTPDDTSNAGVVSPLGGNTFQGVPTQQQISNALNMTQPVPITFGGQTFGIQAPTISGYSAKSNSNLH